jgi:hypothetical protein
MHHGLNVEGTQCLPEFFCIGEITFDERSILNGLSMSGLEVVVDDGLMALAEQFLYNVASDVTCSPGDKYG